MNMEISCDIIKDILPLYAEDMVSNATREMVDEHLCKCDDCTKELASLISSTWTGPCRGNLRGSPPCGYGTYPSPAAYKH